MQITISIVTLLAIPIVGWFLKRFFVAHDELARQRYELLEKSVDAQISKIETRLNRYDTDLKDVRLEYVRREDFAAHVIGTNRRLERIEHKLDRALNTNTAVISEPIDREPSEP